MSTEFLTLSKLISQEAAALRRDFNAGLKEAHRAILQVGQGAAAPSTSEETHGHKHKTGDGVLDQLLVECLQRVIASQNKLIENQRGLVVVIEKQQHTLRQIERDRERLLTVLEQLAASLLPPVSPGPFGHITFVSERSLVTMGQTIRLVTFKAVLPALDLSANPNVASQVVTCSMPGLDPVIAFQLAYPLVQTLGTDATDVTFEGPADQAATLVADWCNAAGLKGPDSPSQSLTISDATLSPAAPGAFGAVSMVSERTITLPDPAPETPPTDPAPETPPAPTPVTPDPVAAGADGSAGPTDPAAPVGDATPAAPAATDPAPAAPVADAPAPEADPAAPAPEATPETPPQA